VNSRLFFNGHDCNILYLHAVVIDSFRLFQIIGAILSPHEDVVNFLTCVHYLQGPVLFGFEILNLELSVDDKTQRRSLARSIADNHFR
jgi:hypothetical protein